MQNEQLENVALKNPQGQKLEEKEKIVVRYLKFYKQQINHFLNFRLPFERIPVKEEYNKKKKYYDKLYEICIKYNINIGEFIKFCVLEKGLQEIKQILNVSVFRDYANNIKVNEQYKNICKDFIKSAVHIAEGCIETNLTPKEYIGKLVYENLLGCEYFTGNLSKYYIASIQNFKEIYKNLDLTNKEELSIIYEATDELTQNLQEAFYKVKNTYVTPISLTEAILKRKLNNKN